MHPSPHQYEAPACLDSHTEVSRQEIRRSNVSHIAPGTTVVDELASAHELTASDRCDSCGAQAYIRVSIGDSELLFCAHHGKKHQEKLAAIATDWHDESSRLLESHHA